jgi:hypothetical protein
VFAVTIPGRLLAKHPKSYALYCGAGYPAFGFVIRKSGMAYMTDLFLGQVADGQTSPEDVVPFLSTVSYNISAALSFGNIVLLFMTDDDTLAAVSSVVSIFTETAGKMYVVWATWRAMSGYLDAVVSQKSGKLGEMIARAQAEAEVGRAIDLARSDDEEGDSTPAAQEEDADEKKTLPHWLDVLTMLALRWYNEIIAEKNCLLVAAFATKVILHSKRSLLAHTRLSAIFYGTEFVTDGAVVYSLGKYFGVPILRLPPQPSMRTGEYWFKIIQTSLTLAIYLFAYKYAASATAKWFADDVIDDALFALGNSTSTTNTTATP